MLLKYK